MFKLEDSGLLMGIDQVNEFLNELREQTPDHLEVSYDLFYVREGDNGVPFFRIVYRIFDNNRR